MSEEPGALFVVATPIGNLEDITIRALRVLREVQVIAAEHVPVALTLLRHFAIDTPVVPYHDRGGDAQQMIDRMEQGESVALVSDAGTPGVSDPGRHLVAAAADAGIKVVPIPGPAASVALWSVSGSDAPRVSLHGFLPRKRGTRRETLREIAERAEDTVIFESPRRLLETLRDVDEILPGCRLVIGRELTKLHEEIWRGTPSEALDAFSEPRGEFTVLLTPPGSRPDHWSDSEIANALADAASQGASRSQAARHVAQRSGRPRRDVYALWPFDQQR